METSKSHARRLAENWFSQFAPANLPGLDLGCSTDLLHPHYRPYDISFGDPDATFLATIPDLSYPTVYASHLLEHLQDPTTALQNFWRVLQPKGHLIIVVPHRDLYEKKLTLPSRFNSDHKHFFLPFHAEPPHTLSLHTLMQSLTATTGRILHTRTLHQGYSQSPPHTHSHGEYSIESIAQKL